MGNFDKGNKLFSYLLKKEDKNFKLTIKNLKSKMFAI